MTAAVVTVDAEIVDQTSDAKALDSEIRRVVQDVEDGVDKLTDLISQAKSERIDVVLGYKSWPAYVADAVRVAPKSIDHRHELTVLLSEQGLTQRAIAEVLGTSKTSVARDLSTGPDGPVGDDAAPKTGLNGKTYKKQADEGSCRRNKERICELVRVNDDKPIREVVELIRAEGITVSKSTVGNERAKLKQSGEAAVYHGRSTANRQIKALESISNSLTAHVYTLEELFTAKQFERTCTPDIAGRYARDFDASLKRIRTIVNILHVHEHHHPGETPQ